MVSQVELGRRLHILSQMVNYATVLITMGARVFDILHQLSALYFSFVTPLSLKWHLVTYSDTETTRSLSL